MSNPLSLSTQEPHKLTEEHYGHIDHLVETAARRLRDKYIKGVEEHGDKIWEKTDIWLLEQAISEAIDQVVYLLTLRDKLLEKL